jgi:hypothetical protein
MKVLCPALAGTAARGLGTHRGGQRWARPVCGGAFQSRISNGTTAMFEATP